MIQSFRNKGDEEHKLGKIHRLKEKLVKEKRKREELESEYEHRI